MQHRIVQRLFFVIPLGLAGLNACGDGTSTADALDGSDASDTTTESDTTTASDTTGAPDTGVDVAEEPAADVQRLTSASYTLGPGEERYYCTSFWSPDVATAIVDITPRPGRLVHHALLVTSRADEPDGLFECETLLDEGWSPIWAGGTGSLGLSLPSGTGFVIPARTRYVLQYHLLNATPETITETSSLDLRYRDDIATPASFFSIGRDEFVIAPGEQSIEALCTLDRRLDVFAVFPHMHQLGKRIELLAGPREDALETIYRLAPWRFGDQPLDPLTLTLEPGTVLKLRCTWDNDTGHDVVWGDSSFDEMCVLLLFASPMDHVDGCGF